MGDDRLTAVLDQIRKRMALILDSHVEPVPVPGDAAGDARLRLAFKDAPRLLAALDRTLKLADEWADDLPFADMSRLEAAEGIREVVSAELLGEPR